MKRLLLISLLLALTLSLAAEDLVREKFMEYWNNPTPENFEQAHSLLMADVTSDSPSNMTQYFLYLMFNREATRTLNTLIENIEQFPAGVQFGIGNALLARGEYTEAIKIYEKLNASSPNWSCPFRHKGEAYLRMSDFPNAEIALHKAIETRETHYDAYLMLAEVYFLQHKYRPALQTMEKAFEVLGAEDEDPEEVYSTEETSFLWWEILKANDDNRARTVEAELREKYPHRF